MRERQGEGVADLQLSARSPLSNPQLTNKGAPPMKPRARAFRKSMTESESLMWSFLRNRQLNGYKFVREFVIDPYIADFVCREEKVIVEIDGSQHEEEDAIEYDNERTAFLEKNGYRVIRFRNCDVLNDMSLVLYALERFMRNRRV
jgi:very-short-patch-repair endonuclease